MTILQLKQLDFLHCKKRVAIMPPPPGYQQSMAFCGMYIYDTFGHRAIEVVICSI